MKFQHTVKAPIQLSGMGLHTGEPVHLALHPAPENTGILFIRTDLHPSVSIPAHHAHVHDTRFNTCITQDAGSVHTIEHILSACAGLQIDNAYIYLDACEVPALDGSALPFARLIQSTGRHPQSALRKYLRLKERIHVQEGDAKITLSPFPQPGLHLKMEIVFHHPLITATQSTWEMELTEEAYLEISSARTFGFLSQYDYLKQNNLGLGASLENTIVLDETTLLNPEGLRSPAEFVQHKLLDAIGDLALLGYPLTHTLFEGYKSGHALNHTLREALLQKKEAWEVCEP